MTPKSQHALTAVGQTGHGDAGIAVSPPPPVAGRGQNPALPSTGLQFPQKTQGHSPSPPCKDRLSPACKQGLPGAAGFSKGKRVPLRKKNPSQSHRGGKQHPAPSHFHPQGTHIPPCPDCPRPGGIYPKAEVAEGRRGRGSRNDGRDPKSPSLREGGGRPRARRIHPRWNQLNPTFPPPEGLLTGVSPSDFQ